MRFLCLEYTLICLGHHIHPSSQIPSNLWGYGVGDGGVRHYWLRVQGQQMCLEHLYTGYEEGMGMFVLRIDPCISSSSSVHAYSMLGLPHSQVMEEEKTGARFTDGSV